MIEYVFQCIFLGKIRIFEKSQFSLLLLRIWSISGFFSFNKKKLLYFRKKSNKFSTRCLLLYCNDLYSYFTHALQISCRFDKRFLSYDHFIERNRRFLAFFGVFDIFLIISLKKWKNHKKSKNGSNWMKIWQIVYLPEIFLKKINFLKKIIFLPFFGRFCNFS